jgi:hypothetical protein
MIEMTLVYGFGLVLILAGAFLLFSGIQEELDKRRKSDEAKKSQVHVQYRSVPSHPNCRSRMRPDTDLGGSGHDQFQDLNGDGIVGNG